MHRNVIGAFEVLHGARLCNRNGGAARINYEKNAPGFYSGRGFHIMKN
jgi:hypothetical protein